MIYSIVINVINDRECDCNRVSKSSKPTDKELLDVALRNLSRVASIESQHPKGFAPRSDEIDPHYDEIVEALSVAFKAIHSLRNEDAFTDELKQSKRRIKLC